MLSRWFHPFYDLIPSIIPETIPISKNIYYYFYLFVFYFPYTMRFSILLVAFAFAVLYKSGDLVIISFYSLINSTLSITFLNSMNSELNVDN